MLYRGLNRNVMLKNVPTDEIKNAIEDCINTAVFHEARNELADMPTPTSKREERQQKTALFDNVGNIAKRKCDAIFRDQLKVAYNKFISSAKCICITRVSRAFHAPINRLTKYDSFRVCKYDKGVGLVVLNADDYYTKLDSK